MKKEKLEQVVTKRTRSLIFFINAKSSLWYFQVVITKYLLFNKSVIFDYEFLLNDYSYLCWKIAEKLIFLLKNCFDSENLNSLLSESE